MAAYVLQEHEIAARIKRYAQKLQEIVDVKIALYQACLVGDLDNAELHYARLRNLESEFRRTYSGKIHFPESTNELKERLFQAFQLDVVKISG